eukprot:TRINITY_DN24286_c0_g1_i1.p2 TRINITY_DN24286_c0_g1~~TRINITY_DN24286_c0_g1_i1.p2  ORF type:complete len:364 (+),score=98.73 TRINITY_DN24286_c0_g1_i1:46-1092(+)
MGAMGRLALLLLSARCAADRGGGWVVDVDLEDALAGCDFASVDVRQVTPESFEADLRHRAPLVMRGSESLALLQEDTATPQLAADLLRDTAPSLRVRTRSNATVEGRVHPSERGERSIHELIENLAELNESALEFSAKGPRFSELLRSGRRGWPDPALTEAFDSADASTLGVWPPWCGAPMHAHEETYFALLHGAKLWLLWPPGALEQLAAMPDLLWPLQVKSGTLYSRLEELPVSARPRRCLQRAGEVLYLPDFWWHSTLNVGETFGFGQQKLEPELGSHGAAKAYPHSCKTAAAVARRNTGDRRAEKLLRRAYTAVHRRGLEAVGGSAEEAQPAADRRCARCQRGS